MIIFKTINLVIKLKSSQDDTTLIRERNQHSRDGTVFLVDAVVTPIIVGCSAFQPQIFNTIEMSTLKLFRAGKNLQSYVIKSNVHQ